MSSIPKVFISYSWSTPAYEQWVLDLATELVNSGVDVVLDKWELREGHDSIVFMEKMVTDKSITKVILICDQVYAKKADERASGVGTETQIISAEMYSSQSQDKFAAVIAEKDESDKPYLPTYYKSRIYVDLSESDRYAENFEKLLRCIFDKPLYIKPVIGTPPSFIIDSNAPLLGTSALAKRIMEAFKLDKAYARGALDEYLSLYAINLERFRITSNSGEPDERMLKSIEDFIPSRGEFIQVISTLCQYAEPYLYVQRVHRFFESMIPYLSNPPTLTSWKESDFDNYKFIVHELFLYTIAILLNSEHIEPASYLLTQSYYISENSRYAQNATVDYTIFREHIESLEYRNKRLGLLRLSLRADLLEQRSKISAIPFRNIMQADFVCFLRADLGRVSRYSGWWPETLIYTHRQYAAFEIFARSTSKTYLAKIIKLIGAKDLDVIKATLDKYANDSSALPRWQHQSFSPSVLMGFDQLGTRE